MPTVADLARRLNSAHPLGTQWRPLILMTDGRRLPDPRPAILALPADAMVIFRHYEATGREALARELLRACRARGLPFLVAGDWRLAARVGADGVHLPEGLIMTAGLRRQRPAWTVTAAAHSAAALHRATAAGVDAILLAPVFATLSHPDAKSLGPHRFARLVRSTRLPVFALGGVTPATAPRLKGSGAVGVAAIGALVPQITQASRTSQRPVSAAAC